MSSYDDMLHFHHIVGLLAAVCFKFVPADILTLLASNQVCFMNKYLYSLCCISILYIWY